MMNELQRDAHMEENVVTWNAERFRVEVSNVDPLYNYLLITNSLRLTLKEPHCRQTPCFSCQSPIQNIEYEFDFSHLTEEEFKKELQTLKFCILLIHKKTSAYQKMLGTIQKSDYFKGNLAANHLMIQSAKIIQTSGIQEVSRMINTSYDVVANDLKNSPLKSTLSEDTSIVDSVPFGTETEEFVLYVTKMQCELENLYRSNLFHEYAWQDEEIEFVMNKIKDFFGDYRSFIQRRRYVCFTFTKSKFDAAFKRKWENTHQQIMLRKYRIIEGKVLNYYLLSKRQILQNEQQTSKLFLLPAAEKIVDLVMLHPWVIIAAQHFVIFLHNYRPMELFKHEDYIIPTKILCSPTNPNHVIIVNKKGSFFFYSLTETTVTLQAVYHIPFLIPCAMAYFSSYIAVAGLDLVQEGVYIKQNFSHKRKVYLICQQLRKQTKNKNKSLSYKSCIEILEVGNEDKAIPITHLLALKKQELLLCCWNNRIFLINVKGEKLVQVELKHKIEKAFEVSFLFNLFNFMLLTADGELIRMGVESYGTGLGTELSRLKAVQSTDCSLAKDQNSKFQIYVCRDRKVKKLSFLSENEKAVVQQREGKIVKLACDKFGITYLVDLQHSIEVKYLEI